MSFDPKLIHPNEPPLKPDGEIDLPDELAALSEQLRDDAANLAACFPATARELRLPPALASRSRRWIKIAVLTCTAAATLLVALTATQLLVRTKQRSPAVAMQPESGAPPENGVPVMNIASPSAVALPAASSSPATISLTELSGPELEALLDLWQREPTGPQPTTISF